MSMHRKLWSLSGLEVETGMDRRTLAKRLANTAPDGELNGNPAWFLRSALRVLREHECRETTGGRNNDILDQLERVVKQINRGMTRLRAEKRIDLRHQVVQEFGPLVGRLDRLLEQSAADQGDDAVVTLAPFRDRIVGGVVAEIQELLDDEPP
jgi:hypothetical protein